MNNHPAGTGKAFIQTKLPGVLSLILETTDCVLIKSHCTVPVTSHA